MRSRILIVKDDQAIAQLIAMTLDLSEHDCALCHDGLQAWVLSNHVRNLGLR